MNPLRFCSIFLFFCTISLLSVNASAEQKMIVLKGDKSMLMDGDRYKFAYNKPQEYGKHKVLPALLSIGWRIQSIHINEQSTGEDMYGYAILERDD